MPPKEPVRKRDLVLKKLRQIVRTRAGNAEVANNEYFEFFKEVPITHATVRRLLLRYTRKYPIWRNIEGYEDLFKRHGLPILTNLITEKMFSSNEKRIRFLDVGAGEGNLKDDLMTMFGDRRISYYGIDMIEHRNPDKSVKVNHFDLMYDSLPNNSFDFIVAGLSIPYVTDKFKALENMINSLRVNGTVAITGFGALRIDGDLRTVLSPLYDEFQPKNKLENAKWLIDKLKESNPFLEIQITENGGVLIKKVKEGKAKMPFKFNGATLRLGSLKASLDSNAALDVIVSNYSYTGQ